MSKIPKSVENLISLNLQQRGNVHNLGVYSFGQIEVNGDGGPNTQS